MQLYYKPGACSMASHIALREAAAAFDLVQVDTDTKTTSTGEDYLSVNPNGYVPALRLDDGQVITEGPAILQHIADTHAAAGLAPAPGSYDRAKVNEYVNFISSELHKAFSPFFSGAELDDAARSAAEAKVLARLGRMDAVLADGRTFLVGGSFSIADAHLFVVASWANYVGISLDGMPALRAFLARIAARESAQAAMKAEGLVS